MGGWSELEKRRTGAQSVSPGIPVSAGDRASASRQAWWPPRSSVVVPHPGCARPGAVPPPPHRWLRGGRGRPRPRQELAKSLRSRRGSRASAAPTYRPCFGLAVGSAPRGAPLPHPPLTVRGDVGQAPPRAAAQLLAGEWDSLSFHLILLWTHPGKLGTTRGKVGAWLGRPWPAGAALGSGAAAVRGAPEPTVHPGSGWVPAGGPAPRRLRGCPGSWEPLRRSCEERRIDSRQPPESGTGWVLSQE